ncbi:hypothetical protein [Bradyrhizobium sp. th.b2]|uniref:hypothetical protein n=1 Tax=Bradyrhizobium sp. th-b2 TaxID=172088 RepID=UPI000429805F|nr:hypothetical protein [Bradyrhizobium sp. th.b2]
MDRQVIFRDYQEQVASDHNNLQDYVQAAMDNIVADGIAATRKYSGMIITKTGQVEVTVGAGRVYDGGQVFGRRTVLTQSLATYVAAAAKRIVTISAYGQEVDTDVETRDYLTDVDTGTVEPRAVSMTRSRDAQIVFTAGAEAADPVPPAVPATHVVVANVLLDTTQIVSIDMLDQNAVVSTDALDIRTDLLEAFRAIIEPRVTSLASDLAELANRINSLGDSSEIYRIEEDLARVKQSLRYPADASGFDADFYLDQNKSDTTNTQLLGYDCKIEEGIRFSDANSNQFEITLFSANDPNARNIGGYLIPAYYDQVKIQTGAYVNSLGMAQYGYQVNNMQVGYMSRTRLRYGGGLSVCTNGNEYNYPGEAPSSTNLYDYGTVGFTTSYVDGRDPYNYFHYNERTDTWWLDTWQEPYMYTVTTDLAITGAQVAQTFLVSNDMICTRLGFYVAAKAANEDIHVTLCEVTNGMPDLTKVILKTVQPQASIGLQWNTVAVQPTFLAKGKRYAVVLISNANHQIGMTSGQSYLDGTFFYSTDGIYYQGDLTKDMMLLVYGAAFPSAQVAIEFAPITLDGGFRTIDILAEQWVPASCQLVFEMRPNGTGQWLPLSKDNADILAQAPPLAQFRARFVGTQDMQPILHLSGSRVKVYRPKTSLKHVSIKHTVPPLSNVANNLTVKIRLEAFDATPHTHAATVRVGSTDYNPASSVVTLEDATSNRYMKTMTFSLPAGTTQFTISQTGTTNSPQVTYHVAERTYYTK